MRCQTCGQDNPPEARFCSKCGSSLAAVTMPTIVIGVGASYDNGWRQMWKYFWMLLLIGIIYACISWVSSIFSFLPAAGGDTLVSVMAISIASSILSIAYNLLIVTPITYGLYFAYLKAARDDRLEVKDMFAAFHNYWNAVLASILVGLIVIVGSIFFIVPGIIFACKLAFTSYLVVDRKMGAIEAIKESWRLTDGHAWQVFLIGLLGIPIAIAGFICLGVGIIIAIIWITLAFAYLYHAVSSSAGLSNPKGELA
jgi:uncharacterized membrane protein